MVIKKWNCRLLLLFLSASCLLYNDSECIIASANSISVNSVDYDKTDVISDLQKLSIADYRSDDNNPHLITFQEYGFDASNTNGYALYAYIYNPAKSAIDISDSFNAVSIASSYDEDLNPTKYSNYKLQYIDSTKSYELYKFKVVDYSDIFNSQLAIYNNTGTREYYVSSLQFRLENGSNLNIFPNTKYIYKGDTQSSLSCIREYIKTITPDVKHTYYRPDGYGSEDTLNQDSLHSVYFSVPNDILDESGEIYSIHASWRDAKLKPILVTGNKDAYSAITDYLGKQVSTERFDYDKSLKYFYLGYDYVGYLFSEQLMHRVGFTYNNPLRKVDVYYDPEEVGGDFIPTLYCMIYSGSSKDSADNYVVSSEQIFDTLMSASKKYGGNLISNRYSECLFESVSDTTDITIKAEDNMTVESYKLDLNFWHYLFAKDKYISTEFSCNAIQKVTPQDKKLSSQDFSLKFLVNTNDSYKIIDYSNENPSETTFIFHYQVTDYIAEQANLYSYKNFLGVQGKFIDSNAYFFQETVNLDFDMIDISFKLHDKVTTLPVSMNSIDIIPSADPPLFTNSSIDYGKYIRIAIFSVLALLAIVIVNKFAPIVKNIIVELFKIIFSIIFLPIKLLAFVFSNEDTQD